MACNVASAEARSRMPTRAPRAANSVAMAWPIPEPPPVTMTVRPANGEVPLESAMDGNGDAVDARRVVGEERLLLGVRPARGDGVDDGAPAAGSAGERAHRPVGAIEETVRAE